MERIIAIFRAPVGATIWAVSFIGPSDRVKSDMKSLPRLLATGIVGLAYLSIVPQLFAADKPLKIGVSAGPYGDILRETARLVGKDGEKAEIIEFSDWTQLNAALQAGDIDLNNFQSRPYLASQIEARGYRLTALDEAILVPAAIHSKRYSAISSIPDGSKVAIPNDPSNAARALALIERAGLLRLKPGVGLSATTLDVAENKKNLRLIEVDAAQLPRSLDDVAAAFIPFSYAYLAGLDFSKVLISETGDAAAKPYFTLVFVARQDRKDDVRLRAFIATYRSKEIKDYIAEKFRGAVLPAW